ncbi:aminotransferase-like domain-containing protein [Roseateles terrae]|uniref:DNA-binding transcriptional MocR family regulator n=1 Tax=Roseateles terrae TaxID=431060 RepID=A0ABR6GS71_9BURK|nr:PLP-dependent aminotransferase family protein [Roseateles terrae]MBB3194973.1 DNA-binding transcriptional MocR family regulator [Roseateles terrae]OWQ85784.1 2-aminoadipate aminotransferase [Roseateles terrae]
MSTVPVAPSPGPDPAVDHLSPERLAPASSLPGRLAPGADPLYEQVAAHYRHAIHSGTMPVGSRMPSVRALMGLHRVSLTTALQACRLLESQGLLQARQRAGYFVRAPRPRLARAAEPRQSRADPAQFVGVHQRVSTVLMQAGQAQVRVHLGGACAAPSLYPVKALALQAQRLLRRRPELLGEAPEPRGHPLLRAALARQALDAGLQLHPQQVLVTHGCTEALGIALRATTQPGDTVAVESPTYYGLLQILETLGLRALEIPASPHTGLSLPALQEAARREPGLKAVVVVPHLQNPLGSLMPDDSKQALLAWCEQMDRALIEDDTYAALADQPQRAIKSWDQTGRVIFCASLHKTLAPGMRLGWMTGGRWQARVEVLKYAQSRPNEMLGQAAVAEFLMAGHMARHLRSLRARLADQREVMAQLLSDHLPEGTRMSLPPGGMNLWVELPEGLSSMALFEAALTRGVRIAPGAMFSNSMRFDRCIRINAGYLMDDAQREAVQTLGELCRQLQGRSVAGVFLPQP